VSGRPPTALRAIAAATTPVVAAAFLAIALLAAGCDARLAVDPTGPAATPGPPMPATTPGGEPAAPRLLVAAGAPAAPRLVLHHLAGGAGALLPAPAGLPTLAAVAVAPDGTLAVVAPDGRAWRAELPPGVADAVAWRPMGRADLPGGLPGPVLGAAWSPTGDALLVAAGAPGSGLRRTAVAALPADGSPGRAAVASAEADGPGLAALPGGDALLALRNAADAAVLARVTPAGAVAFLPLPARAVAAGGGIVAVAGDAGVLVGDLAALARGVVPAEPLPLEGDDGVAGVAVAPDGGAVAVVRLDAAGLPARVDVVERVGGGWRGGPPVPLDAATGNVLLTWAPAP
jgi:hypothetical protein